MKKYYFLLLIIVISSCAKKNDDPLIIPPNFSELPDLKLSEKPSKQNPEDVSRVKELLLYENDL